MKKNWIEECDNILTEAVFTHRWELLMGYHEVGRIVVKHDLPIEEVAIGTGQRPKTIHYCKELYKTYPRLDDLPDGKNVSWYKITKTLPPYEKSK
jgi:hypothetical protein